MSSIAGKRICFITGTRADFGKLEPLATAVRDAGAEVSFFITGMHMMKRYGETRIEVKRLQGVEFFEYVNQREGDALDLVLSKTVMGFSDFVHEHKPDLVVIHGDRIEALAASVVCAIHYIRSAHIEGGEVSGTIDESIRHCNTKLCASHFVSSNSAEKRVLQLGEVKERVFKIGSPELDCHLKPSGVGIAEVKRYYEIKFAEFGIVTFHPVTSEQETMANQAQSLFKALKESGRCFVVIAPNNDPGSEAIFSVINALPESHFRVIPSMRFSYFSELMKNAAVMVGNSSAGVREAPFLGLPSIDIGTRQRDRKEADSVYNCSALDRGRILATLNNCWGKQIDNSSEFGSGDSCEKFVATLSDSGFWELPDQKVFAS